MALIPVPSTKPSTPQDAQYIQHDKDYKDTLIRLMDRNLADHPAKLLKEYLEQVHQIFSYNPENVQTLFKNLENIKGLIENYDNAIIFSDVGGFQIFTNLFQYSNDDILRESCDILAELCQNHKICQDESQKYNLLPTVINILILNENKETKIKAFYALSNMLRGNERLQKDFINLNGIDVLLQSLECDIDKIRIKATLLVMYMSLENPEIRSNLYVFNIIIFFLVNLLNKGVLIKLMNSAINQEHNLDHEHIFNAILTIIKSDVSLVKDFKQMYPDLKAFLHNRASLLSGKPEYIEEENYVKVLYQMCFEDNLDGALGSLSIGNPQ